MNLKAKFSDFVTDAQNAGLELGRTYNIEEWKSITRGMKGWMIGAWKKSPEAQPSIRNCIEGYMLRYIAGGKVTRQEAYAVLDAVAPGAMPPKLEDDGYDGYIPESSSSFVETGRNWRLVDKIVSEKRFFPVYIYGISGLGKTFQIEQACAKHHRPFFRVQVTKDSTSEDLVGSYSLIDGNTVWVDGPILKAYRSGGILLLDEIDLNPSLMVLQGVLENKPLYVFQTGELVKPAPGFQVFATGNTKGDGSSYEYVGTTTLNKAFLERFDWIIEQKIPSIKTERRIIERWLKVMNIKMPENLLETFFKFIDIVWKSWQSGDGSIFLSTRRIQSIIKGWTVCESIEYAIELALAHYSDEEAKALVNAWKAIAPAEKTVADDDQTLDKPSEIG